MNLLELKSVGSWADVQNQIVYPSLSNGKPDLNNPFPFDKEDLSKQYWLECLSFTETQALISWFK